MARKKQVERTDQEPETRQPEASKPPATVKWLLDRLTELLRSETDPHGTVYGRFEPIVRKSLQDFTLTDTEGKILDICARDNLPAPTCGQPGESREVVALRLKEWCLNRVGDADTPAGRKSQPAEMNDARAPIEDGELEVLEVLDERGTLTTIQTIQEAFRQKNVIRSETTIKTYVRRLLTLGLIDRPRPRKGVCLTLAGKAQLSL